MEQNQNYYQQDYSGQSQQYNIDYSAMANGSTNYSSVVSSAPQQPATPRSLDAILYTFIGALSVLFLWISDIFTMEKTVYVTGTGSTFALDKDVSTFTNDFTSLFRNDIIGYVVLIMISIAIAALIFISWIEFSVAGYRGKNVKYAKVVFSAVALVLFLGSSIYTSSAYEYSYRYPFMGTSTLENVVQHTFLGFEPMFYVILIAFLLITVLAVVNEKGKIIIKSNQ